MLRKYSNSRSLEDNMKLGGLTAFTAGMVNVASLILFFAFTSNITGHYAILAEEISKGKWFQVFVVFGWIFLFFSGSFLSNYLIIHSKKSSSLLTHSIPLLLEVICFLVVGFYGHFYYSETLIETEALVALLLFGMGLQNGLTASISNFTVKTTHLTGLTTDLAIHLSMLTHKEHSKNPVVRNKIKLMLVIVSCYLVGGITAGMITHYFQFKVFFYISIAMLFIIAYDLSQLLILSNRLRRTVKARAERKAHSRLEEQHG